MRIGQAAHVEHQIGIQRQAVLEAEGFEQQRQARAIQRDELLDPCAQRIGVEFAGVDVMADVGDLGEQFAFLADAFRQGLSFVETGIAQRMQAACFGKAFDQRLGLRIEEQHMHVDVLLFDLLQ